MVRRTLVIALLVVVALACAAPVAAAYQPIVGHAVAVDSVLVPGAEPAAVVWPASGGTQLLAQQFPHSGAPGPVRTVATGITSVARVFAAGDGTRVTVVWQDGSTVWAACIDLADGSTVFGPVAVCTDAEVAALEGAATGATLSGAAPDGDGGAYVWCRATPSRGITGFGDSLLNHISPTGALAVDDPGRPIAKGTIAGLSADNEGHAFALLAPPGRAGLATQRLGKTLVPDTGWSNPVSPYTPLLPVPNATPTAVAVTAGSGATIAWREGSKVKVQRYPREGGVIWVRPPAVSMTAGDVGLASDGLGGAYLAGPSGAGILAGHVLSSGSVTTHTLSGLSLTQPAVRALATNRAGDLFIGYGDLGAPATAGIRLLTWTGGLTAIGPPDMRPDVFDSAVPDGCGGAYLAGSTTGTGYLWRVGAGPGLAVTLRPRALSVLWGKPVAIGGYVTQDATPASGATVAFASSDGGAGAPPPPAHAGVDGYYSATLTPKANAVWTASSGAGVSDGVRIEVRPTVTMTMSHPKASTRLSEIFSGAVSPSHKGRSVVVQRSLGGDRWKKIASGRLDSRSRYRITWFVPRKTATYKLRVILPAHADHAQGTSRTGSLRVVVK
jgi:hypothetical protein